MIEDKIRQLINKIRQEKTALKAIKKDLKAEEKIDNQDYLDLEKSYKDLRKQIKDFKEEWEQELLGDDNYLKLKELAMNKEEELAHLKEKLNFEFSKLPPKPVLLEIETEDGPVKIQIMPEMRLYLNGKEEKVKLG